MLRTIYGDNLFSLFFIEHNINMKFNKINYKTKKVPLST
jgi:hypothetical protein